MTSCRQRRSGPTCPSTSSAWSAPGLVSPRDRVRFTAVCRPWRAAASLQPAHPVVAPLLFLSPLMYRDKAKHLCGTDDSWVCRVPSKLANRRFFGSHDGGWVAAVDMPNCQLAIVNLFSGAEVPLTKAQSELKSMTGKDKFIFSRDPSSPDGCVIAAVLGGRLNITWCRIGCQDGRWTTCRWVQRISDIAFCNGELYALTIPHGQLVKFEVEMEKDHTLKVTAIHQPGIQNPEDPTWDDNRTDHVSYIFEWHGKLALAVKTRWLPNVDAFIKVFKLVDLVVDDDDDDDGAYNKHKWVEETCFGDYALFIGPMRSKAVHVPAVSAEHGGLERNRIYYTQHNYLRPKKLPCDVVYSVESDDGDGHHVTMYCRRDQSIGDGVERTGYYVVGWNYALWVHAPDL